MKKLLLVALVLLLTPSIAYALDPLTVINLLNFPASMTAGGTYPAKVRIISYSWSEIPVFFTLYINTSNPIEAGEFSLAASINGLTLNCTPSAAGYPRYWEEWVCKNGTGYYMFPSGFGLGASRDLDLNLTLNIAASPQPGIGWHLKIWVQDTNPPIIILNSPENKSYVKSGTLINLSVVDDVKVEQVWCGLQLFYDDFADVNASKWTKDIGPWFVIDNEYTHDSGYATNVHNFSSAGNPSWVNYTVEAKVNVLRVYGTAYGSSILVRYTDMNNFYMCQLRVDQNALQIWKRVSGTWSILNSTTNPFQVNLNTWHTLRCKVEGNRIFAYVNNGTHATSVGATDNSLTSGKIALNNYNTYVHFDNVTVNSVNLLQDPYDINTTGWPEGLTYINVSATDVAGNKNQTVLEFTFDNTPPSVTSISVIPSYKANWTNATPMINATIYENGSGLNSCRISTDNGAHWNTGVITGTKPVYTCIYQSPSLPDGSWRRIKVNVTDNVNNKKVTGILWKGYVDAVAPDTTKAYGLPFYTNSTHEWINSSTQIMLTFLDLNISPSGVNYTQYSIDGASWINYSSPFNVSSEGMRTIYYRSIDNVDNIEANKSQNVIVDNTPPATTKTVGDPKHWNGTHWFINSSTQFNLTAQDGGAVPVGVNKTFYRYCKNIAGCSNVWKKYTSPFKVIGLPDGPVRIEYYSIDRLNNIESPHFEIDILDNTPPIVENSTVNETIQLGQNETVTVDVVDESNSTVDKVLVEDYLEKYKFDFGSATSPVQKNYTRITRFMAYNASVGYGWETPPSGDMDRLIGTNLTRDFIFDSANKTFIVDLPDGVYIVTALLGDMSYSHDNIDVYAEGQLKLDNINTSAGEIKWLDFIATVSDTQLNITFVDDGGSNPHWTCAGLIVKSYVQTYELELPTWEIHSTYVGTIPYPAAGLHSVRYLANDTVGNINDTVLDSFYVNIIPTLTNISSNNSCVRQNDAINITTYNASDLNGDDLILRVSSSPQAYDLCNSSAGQPELSCVFNASWNDTGPHTIYGLVDDSMTVSEERSITIFSDNTGPEAPINLTPTFTNDTTPTFSWLPSTDIGCSGTSKYRISVYNNPDCTSLNRTELTSSTSYTFPDNFSTGTYSWRVRAEDGFGNLGNWSACTILTIDVTPPIATSVLINPANYFNGAAHVKLGEVNFTITMSESMDNSTSLTVKIINTTTYTIPPHPNLTNGWLNFTTWVGTFTVTNSTGDGNYTIDISGGKDLAGNLMVENTSNWFIINTISPIVQSIIITPSVDNTYVKTGSTNFTIIFNEIMNTYVNPTVTFGLSPPYSTYNITPIGWINKTTWVGNFNITNSVPSGDKWYTISISGAVDLSGNVMITDTSKKFLVDRRPPRVWNIWVADPITTEEDETVSVRVSDEKTIGQEASGVDEVIVELNGSANFTMTLSYNYTYIGGAYFYYYAIIPNSSYGPGLQNITIYVKDTAGNVNDTAKASFTVSSPTKKIKGTIAFLCRDDLCNDNIEDELILWLRSKGWNVTGKKYSKWTSSELDNYNLTMCSDEDYACNYGTRRGTIVYDKHTKQGKPFVEVGDNRFLRTAYNLGYASSTGGYILSGTDKIFITVADTITTGYFDSTKIFTSNGTMTKIADNLVDGKDLADAGQEDRMSTFFKSDQTGLRGRYVYLGWFGGGSFTSLSSLGNTTLARAISWAQCGDAKGCS